MTSSLSKFLQICLVPYFSASASSLLKNVASIVFVLQVMRFDTVHTLVNRYGMLDFAQFIQMEAKVIKYFLAVGSPMNRSNTKQQSNKNLCKICVKSIHESIQINKRKTAAKFQHNKTFSFVFCVRSINW